MKNFEAVGSYVVYFNMIKWAASSEFGTYRLCEQRRFRRAYASAQSRQNLRCSLIQTVRPEEPSDRKPDSWPLWMAGHAQLKFVMTECSKTQIRLTRPKWMTQKHTTTLISVIRLPSQSVINWATSRENVSSGIFKQVRFKPACLATEASWNHETLDIASIHFILSKQRATKVRRLICAFVVCIIWHDTFWLDLAQFIFLPTDCKSWLMNIFFFAQRLKRNLQLQETRLYFYAC